MIFGSKFFLVSSPRVLGWIFRTLTVADLGEVYSRFICSDALAVRVRTNRGDDSWTLSVFDIFPLAFSINKTCGFFRESKWLERNFLPWNVWVFWEFLKWLICENNQKKTNLNFGPPKLIFSLLKIVYMWCFNICLEDDTFLWRNIKSVILILGDNLRCNI